MNASIVTANPSQEEHAMNSSIVRFSIPAALCAAILLLGLTAHATNFTWTGGINENWAVDGNWNNTGFPDGTDDTASITTAANVDLNGAQVSAQLTVSAANAVTLTNSAAGALTLGVSGGAAVSSFIRSTGTSATSIDAPVTIAGLSTSGASFDVSGNGTLTLNGTVDMTAAKTNGNQYFVALAYGAAPKVTFNGVVNYGSIGTRQRISPANGEVWFNADNSNISSIWNVGFFIIPTATTTGTGTGTVVLGHNNALGLAQIHFGENDNAQSDNRLLRLALGAAGLTVNNPIRMRGQQSGQAVGGIHTSGVSTFAGGIELNAAANPGRFFSENAAATTRFSGLISRVGPVVVQGAGTVEFNRAAGNTYEGITTVTSGTLLVNNTSGSGTGIGAGKVVTVQTGGTLGGIGIVSNATTIAAGGVLMPGTNGVGTLTFGGNVTVQGTLRATCDVNGSTTRAAVGGALDLTGATLQVTVPPGKLPGNIRALVIASYGSLNGVFGTVAGTLWEIDYNYQGNKQIAILVPPMGTIVTIR